MTATTPHNVKVILPPTSKQTGRCCQPRASPYGRPPDALALRNPPTLPTQPALAPAGLLSVPSLTTLPTSPNAPRVVTGLSPRVTS